MNRAHYPSDLTDREWAVPEPLLPDLEKAVTLRSTPTEKSSTQSSTLTAPGVRGGCSLIQSSWTNGDLPNWRTVYHYFRAWRLDGTWERVQDAVREKVPGLPFATGRGLASMNLRALSGS